MQAAVQEEKSFRSAWCSNKQSWFKIFDIQKVKSNTVHDSIWLMVDLYNHHIYIYIYTHTHKEYPKSYVFYLFPHRIQNNHDIG